MGFFNRAGRTVEQFTQTAKDVAAQEAEYQCGACEELFQTDHDECPECGAAAVEPRATEE